MSTWTLCKPSRLGTLWSNESRMRDRQIRRIVKPDFGKQPFDDFDDPFTRSVAGWVIPNRGAGGGEAQTDEK